VYDICLVGIRGLIQTERHGAMANCPALILQLAAMAGVAAVLSIATPSMAADGVPAAGAASVVKMAPSVIARHAARTTHGAASDHRRIRLASRHLDCSGVWCGRQFVLMVGIAY
jgi:hypothetical protein